MADVKITSDNCGTQEVYINGIPFQKEMVSFDIEGSSPPILVARIICDDLSVNIKSRYKKPQGSCPTDTEEVSLILGNSQVSVSADGITATVQERGKSMKTFKRTLYEDNYFVEEDADTGVSVSVNTCNIPEEKKNQIENAVADMLNLVREILS